MLPIGGSFVGKVPSLMLTQRRARRSSLAALLAGILAGLGLYAIPSATAAPTDGPTDLRVYFGGPGDKAGETVSIHAAVKPTGAVGQVDDYPTGTVTFSVGDGLPKDVSPYGATTGFNYTIPSNAPFTVTATFHGTGGWEDSTYTATFKPLTRPYWGPVVPTVASIGAGGLKVNLKFSASIKNALGQGIAGRQIIFSLFNRLPQIADPASGGVVVCTALTDANGEATCTGLTSLGTIVTVLTGGAYANDTGPTIKPVDQGYSTSWIKIPAILIG